MEKNTVEKNKIFKPILLSNKNYISNLKLRSLGYFSRYKFLNNLSHQLSDPVDILKRFAESKIIMTTTFHGVIMALITRRPFLAIADKNLLARLSSYKVFYSGKRVINLAHYETFNKSVDLEELENINDIDYEALSGFVSNSFLWLENALKN